MYIECVNVYIIMYNNVHNVEYALQLLAIIFIFIIINIYNNPVKMSILSLQISNWT